MIDIDQKGSAWTGLITLAIGAAVFAPIFVHGCKKNEEARVRHSDPNFPQLTIERRIEDVRKADGGVEKKIIISKGREYVLRSCYSQFNPKPQDVDGPYNSENVEIVCVYDLEGERSYMGALERAEEIYAKEMEARK
ncbi:hypothetical protein HYT25_04940 [Candidatus Pacearchaeota archaeon]|nr:hypothetical protein [Candidatus Pacearchaeota archaeon]